MCDNEGREDEYEAELAVSWRSVDISKHEGAGAKFAN